VDHTTVHPCPAPPLLAHRVNWRSAATCLELGLDRK
jgi:hypothetical protein